MLIVLPSGADTTRSMRMLSPADGATVSLSKASSIAASAAACFLPASLFASASRSSRLATSPVARQKIDAAEYGFDTRIDAGIFSKFRGHSILLHSTFSLIRVNEL